MKGNVRHQAALAATSALVVSSLVGVATSASAGVARDSGFEVRGRTHWIGAHQIGALRVYRSRVTRPVGRDYAPAKTRGGSAARMRAAYILSRYGNRGGPAQAAAVDAALQDLLHPARLGLKGRAGSRRIRELPRRRRSTVRRLARQLVRIAKTDAGSYTATISTATDSVPAGTGSRLRIMVAGTGARAPGGVSVQVRYGRSVQTVHTGPDGTARVVLDTLAGAQRATAVVSGLPEWRLHRMRSIGRGSPMLVAGRTATLTASTTVIGSTTQGVGVRNNGSSILVGASMGGSYTVTGGTGSRTVNNQVIGPSGTTTVSCTAATSPYTVGSVVSGPGTYPLPGYRPTQTGYYAWRSSLGGNRFTAAVRTCGPVVRVQRRAAIGQTRNAGADAKVRRGHEFDVDVKVSGFDRSEAHTVTSQAYGPFSRRNKVACTSSSKLWKRVARSVSGNGTFDMPNVVPGNQAFVGKWFGWRSTLSAGNFMLGASSSCGVAFKVIE